MMVVVCRWNETRAFGFWIGGCDFVCLMRGGVGDLAVCSVEFCDWLVILLVAFSDLCLIMVPLWFVLPGFRWG